MEFMAMLAIEVRDENEFLKELQKFCGRFSEKEFFFKKGKSYAKF